MEGGLDALNSIAQTQDPNLQLRIFNTAFNATHRRAPYEAALKRRPALLALYERYYAKFGSVLDAKPLEGGVPANASPAAIVANIRAPGRNARQLGSDVYQLTQAIKRGETGAVLAAAGDVAVMEAERDPGHQGPEYGALHSNVFFFLAALRTSIELGDGRFETNLNDEGRAAANRVLASGGANVTAKTGLIYAPAPMSFSESGGLFACFGQSKPAQPVARDRGLGDMLLPMAGMALMGGMGGPRPGYGGGFGGPMMGGMGGMMGNPMGGMMGGMMGGNPMGGMMGGMMGGNPMGGMMGGYGGGYGRPGMGGMEQCCPMLCCACCAYLCCQALD
eukprot:tig00021127_g18836.t1